MNNIPFLLATHIIEAAVAKNVDPRSRLRIVIVIKRIARSTVAELQFNFVRMAARQTKLEGKLNFALKRKLQQNIRCLCHIVAIVRAIGVNCRVGVRNDLPIARLDPAERTQFGALLTKMLSASEGAERQRR